jgi:hypothetical protein
MFLARKKRNKRAMSSGLKQMFLLKIPAKQGIIAKSGAKPKK